MNTLVAPSVSTRTYKLKKVGPSLFEEIFNTIKLQLELCHYQPQTIRAYMGRLYSFARFFHPKGPESVTIKDITDYLNDLVEAGASRSTVDQTVTALDFLSRELLEEPLELNDFKRPPKKNSEPELLTQEEAKDIAMSAENPKHRLMLELMYSAGLRVSEIVDVRVAHLNLDKFLLYVPGTKSLKGRTTHFSPELKDALIRQIGKKSGNDFIFPSEKGGQLTTRSVAKFFKAALHVSDVSKPATPHTLRQSFAANLIKDGADPLFVQQTLGRSTL